jgi:hypothetical protein
MTHFFLHIKMPRITNQGYKMNVERSAMRSLAEENPMYARTTPEAMVTTPADIPTAPIHLPSTVLFTIATPKISEAPPPSHYIIGLKTPLDPPNPFCNS